MYSIYPKEYKGFSLPGFIFAHCSFLGLIVLCIKKGKIISATLYVLQVLYWINLPYSPLLKLISIKTAVQVADYVKRSVRANCIDKKEKIIDFERCVSCYNCFTVCPKDGVIFTSPHIKKIIFTAKVKEISLRNTGIYFLGFNGLMKCAE